MGRFLHGCATTTHAVRAAIQRTKAPVAQIAERHGLNRKTVMKWRARGFVDDAPMGPKAPRSTVPTAQEEAVAVAFRRHTLLPLDDCLYALQATIPHLTRSSLHRLFQRHDISRLPAIEVRRPEGRRSRPIQSATSTSTWRRWEPNRASSTCSWGSTAPRVRLRRAARAGQQADRRRLPSQANPGGPLQGPHGADRPRHRLHNEKGQNRVSASILWRAAQALDVAVGYFFDGLQGRL